MEKNKVLLVFKRGSQRSGIFNICAHYKTKRGMRAVLLLALSAIVIGVQDHPSSKLPESTLVLTSEPAAIQYEKQSADFDLQKESDQTENVHVHVSNDVENECIYKVSQSSIDTYVRSSIQRIINESSCSSIEISLIDKEHDEQVNISRRMSIAIDGDARNTENELIQTIWKVQRYYRQIISLQDSNLTLSNIVFRFTLVYNFSSLIVSPSYSIIYINNTNANLTLKNCIFKGFGLNRTEISSMIDSNITYKMEIDNCSFSDIVGRNALNISNCTLFTVKKCKFTDIVGSYYSGAIYLYFSTSRTVTYDISDNIFERCINYFSSNNGNNAGAIYITFNQESQAPIIKINNNYFKDCLGFYTGGIYLSYVTAYILEVQNNIFEGNRIQSSNTHSDAYIYKRGSDTLLPNASEYIKTVFSGSVSSQTNSVYNYYYYSYSGSLSLGILSYPSFERKFISQDETQDYISISAAIGIDNTQLELEARIVGLIHSEQIIIGENKGWMRNRITIIGDENRTRQRVTLSEGSENEGENQYIILIEDSVVGDIIIQNFEMQRQNCGFLKAEGGKSIALRECSFFGGDTIIHNSPVRFEITLCDFIGNSQLSEINSFVSATKGTIDIFYSTFYQGSFSGQGSGCVVCSQQCSACLIDGCQFLHNILGAGSSAIAVTTLNCLQLSVQGNSFSRTVFSDFGINNPIKGHFIRSISSKINISHTDFTDASFACGGNAIKIDEQLPSEITLLKCNFIGLRGINNRRSICIQASLSSLNGFKFNCHNCSFSECSFSGTEQVIGNSITISSQESLVLDVNREILFQYCEFRRNTGSGLGGAIGFNIEAQQSNIYNLANVQIELYVSSSGSSNNDGTKARPFNNITYAIARLANYQSQLQPLERTIFILNETCDAYLTIDAQDEWTNENYMDKVADLFKGSTSPVNQSIAVQVRFTNQTITPKQNITLPTEIDQDDQQPTTPEIVCEQECIPTETTPITECECQMIGDPRSECQSQYPLICTSKGYPSPDCICPSESVTSGYTKAQCERDKFCS
ncbi:MAG: hypothetical protein EZS28_024520, partial [Streblomastix strix]